MIEQQVGPWRNSSGDILKVADSELNSKKAAVQYVIDVLGSVAEHVIREAAFPELVDGCRRACYSR